MHFLLNRKKSLVHKKYFNFISIIINCHYLDQHFDPYRSSVMFKNAWLFSSTPTYDFMAAFLRLFLSGDHFH